MAIDTFISAWAPRLLSVMRIIIGFLFLWHGSQKLFNFPPSPTPGPGGAFMLFAGSLEFFGGLLIMIGLFTRPVAFILSGMAAFAYFLGHWPRNFFPLLNNGDAAVLYSFIFLYLFGAGGGAWSVDRMLGLSKD